MISDECKAYEKFALTAWHDAPFPISKSKLIRYIKHRARSGTFPTFMTNLEKHPLHGRQWHNEMNSDPDIKKLMQFSLNLWPRQMKECRSPLIGVGFVNKTSQDSWTELTRKSEKKLQDDVRVVHGPKIKGFMVPKDDDALEESIFDIKKSQSILSTSQLSSDKLYIPSPKERIFADELEVIDAKQFHGLDEDPFEEGSSSSSSSKKNSKEEDDFDYADMNDFEMETKKDIKQDDEFDYDMYGDDLNDFEVDLGDFYQPEIEMASFEGFAVDNQMEEVDEIETLCNMIEMETCALVDQVPMDDDSEDDGQIKQVVVRIESQRRPRGRPRTKPLFPKRRVGRPKKQIMIPEPKVVIKREM